MTRSLVPDWRRVACAAGFWVLSGCGGNDECTGDDDGHGNLAAAYASIEVDGDENPDDPQPDPAAHESANYDVVCNGDTDVEVFNDVPVDEGFDGQPRKPFDAPLATAKLRGESPATFDVPAGTYIVCWVPLPERPTPCTRVAVGTERVVVTYHPYTTPKFKLD